MANKREIKEDIRLEEFEIVELLDGEKIVWNGSIVLDPSSHSNTFALNGIVNSGQKRGYLSAAKGIGEDGIAKFTIFTSDDEPIDFILKQDPNNGSYWYGRYYIKKGNEVKKGFAQLHRCATEKQIDINFVSDIYNWIKTEEGISVFGQDAYKSFVDKSNVNHHSFSEEDYNDGRNYFLKNDQKTNMRLAIDSLKDEKSVIKKLILAKISGNDESELAKMLKRFAKTTDDFIGGYCESPRDKTIYERNSLFDFIIQERNNDR